MVTTSVGERVRDSGNLGFFFFVAGAGGGKKKKKNVCETVHSFVSLPSFLQLTKMPPKKKPALHVGDRISCPSTETHMWAWMRGRDYAHERCVERGRRQTTEMLTDGTILTRRSTNPTHPSHRPHLRRARGGLFGRRDRLADGQGERGMESPLNGVKQGEQELLTIPHLNNCIFSHPPSTHPPPTHNRPTSGLTRTAPSTGSRPKTRRPGWYRAANRSLLKPLPQNRPPSLRPRPRPPGVGPPPGPCPASPGQRPGRRPRRLRARRPVWRSALSR